MIHLRIIAGITQHFATRWSEWLMAWPLMGWSAVLREDPMLFERAASFSELARWFTEGTWAAICLGACLIRLLALVVNGTFRQFPYAPHLRLAASAIAAFFWAQITLGVLVAWLLGIGVGTPVIAYSTFMAIELFNVFWASGDVGASRRGGVGDASWNPC